MKKGPPLNEVAPFFCGGASTNVRLIKIKTPVPSVFSVVGQHYL